VEIAVGGLHGLELNRVYLGEGVLFHGHALVNRFGMPPAVPGFTLLEAPESEKHLLLLLVDRLQLGNLGSSNVGRGRV
jgi:hypothetical protein